MSQLKVLGLSLGAALFLAAFAGLLYPTSGIGSAWNDFGSAVANTPNWPSFNDPFSEDEFVTTQLTPDANSTIGEDAPTVVGCPANAYFMCLWNFTSGSYIELDVVETQFSVSMDTKALRPAREIVMVFFDVACYSTTNTSWAAFMVDEDGLVQYFFTGHCTPNSWRVTRERWEGLTAIESVGYSTMFDEGNGTEILFAVGNATARISYLRVFLMISTETTCPTFGDWWSIGDNLQVIACQIGKFINTGVRLAFWLINGVVWFVTSIALALIYIAGVIVSFLTTVATVVVFFIAVPNVPPIVQAVIAIPFIIVGAVFIYSITTLLRGTGPI